METANNLKDETTTTIIQPKEQDQNMNSLNNTPKNTLSITQLLHKVMKESETVVDVCKKDMEEFVTVVSSEAVSTYGLVQAQVAGLTKQLTSKMALSMAGHEPHSEENKGEAIGASAPGSAPAQGTNESDFRHVFRHYSLNLKESLSKYLHEAISVAAPPMQQEEPSQTMFSHKDIMLNSLRTNRATYIQNPSEGPEKEDFQVFMKDFLLQKKMPEVPILLEDDIVLKLFEELVPNQITNEEFWTRYFFREWELEEREKKRKEILKAADQQDDDDFDWDDDDKDENELQNKGTEVKESTEPFNTPDNRENKNEVKGEHDSFKDEAQPQILTADSKETDQPII